MSIAKRFHAALYGALRSGADACSRELARRRAARAQAEDAPEGLDVEPPPSADPLVVRH